MLEQTGGLEGRADIGCQTEHCEDESPGRQCDTGCQTDPMEQEALLVLPVEEPFVPIAPWIDENSREEWGEWFRLQAGIGSMAIGLDCMTGWDEMSIGAKRCVQYNMLNLHERIRSLLAIPPPSDMPSYYENPQRKVVVKAFESAPPRKLDVEVYRRADAFKLAQKQAKKTSALDTGSRVPYWCSPEEWPLWAWDEETVRHCRVPFPRSMKKGPYWCPVSDWDKWVEDPVRGWVPVRPLPSVMMPSERKKYRSHSAPPSLSLQPAFPGRFRSVSSTQVKKRDRRSLGSEESSSSLGRKRGRGSAEDPFIIT